MGFENITGLVLQENRNMLALGKKLGFKMVRQPDVGEYEFSMHFNTK
jgi:hypothetical protein